MMRTPIITALFFLIPTTLSLCPPPGPILPPPTLAPKSSNFSIPEAVFNNFTFLGDNSFAIKASIGNTTVFEYEHSAPGREVNQSLFKTKIRIASATKLITALAIELSKNKISLEDSITKFIPGLREEYYGDVTIRALTDHTSGLGRFGYVGDLATSATNTTIAGLGLPFLPNTLPGCDPVPGGRICTPQEVLDLFNNPAYRPYSPNSRAMYSNIAYILLGKALEAVHNTTYEDVIQTLILDPVGMTSSTFSVPDDDGSAILPRKPEDDSWFVPYYGNLNPVGGMWSTPNDMLSLLQALQNNQLMSAVQMREWMQPTTFLRSLHQFVGVAWEIFRIDNLPLDFPRPIDIYTKAGGVPGYGSYAVLIPEYQIAITINAAGTETSYSSIDLLNTVVTHLVPYADKLAREQAKKKYAGTYTFGNSSITFSSTSGPGLSVDSLVVNNVPVLQRIAASQKIEPKNFSARLYPTDPDSLGTGEESWRMLLDQKVAKRKYWAELECMSWNLGDWGRYIREPLDTVVFHICDGKVESVELLGWRVTLNKVE